MWTRNYEAVRTTLADGHGYVSAVIDLSKCTNNVPEPPTLVIVTEQFRTWNIINVQADPTQSYITSDQFFLDGKTNLQANDITTVSLHIISGLDLSSIFDVVYECEMGPTGGATYFVRDAAVEYDDLNDYNSLKSALVIGRHIFAILDLGQCSPAIEGAVVQAGFYIDDWEVYRDGSTDEVLEIFYPYKFIHTGDGQGSDYGITTAMAFIRGDQGGTVTISNALLDLMQFNNESPYQEFTCQLGTSMKFYAPHLDIEEATYQTYQQVLDGLITAHELEAMIFGRYCEWDGDDDQFNIIYGHRFYHYDWQGPSAPGPQNYIEFQDALIAPTGAFVDEDYRVLEDDTLVWNLYRVDPITGEQTSDRAICPLGTGALFRAELDQRTELTTFDEIEQVILQGGHVNFEVIVPECISNGEVTVPPPGIFGGSLLQTLDIDEGNNVVQSFQEIQSILTSNTGLIAATVDITLCTFVSGDPPVNTLNTSIKQMSGSIEIGDHQGLLDALAQGKEVLVVANFSSCDHNSDLEAAGFSITEWNLIYGGIMIYHPWTIVPNPDDNSRAAVQSAVIMSDSLSPAAAILVQLREYYYPGDLLQSISLTCLKNEGIRFFSTPGNETTYETYTEVFEALGRAEDITMVVDGFQCQWDNEEIIGLPLHSHRISHYNWWGPTASGPQNYLEIMDVFSNFHNLVTEDYKILETNSLVWTMHVLDLETNEENANRGVCPLETAVQFYTSGIHKVELENFLAIEEAVLQGRHISWEADFTECTGDQLVGSAKMGGILLQTYDVNTDSDGKLFYAAVVAKEKNQYDGRYYWTSTDIIISSSDNLVTIRPHVYDPDTWENIYPSVTYYCVLGDAAKFYT
ncbi:unnamed protein product [Notodromas monacha]|uniref:Uncharacterized protein n=1 Tax=Notodromas monacha TaxID=399045 RepID=A0A7R9G855_9CRUS|nr:unnamed protein product [Notodromas monacha]CAG0912922.1 unnamed protein product [Notodromas monacha]